MDIDKKQLKIAKKYADAIYEVAKEASKTQQIFEELDEISKLLENSPDLKSFLESPVMNISDKKEIIKKVFEKDFDKDILNLLYVLVEKNRFKIFKTLVYSYREAMEKDNGISRINIISAVELNKETKNKLEEKLAKKMNKKVLADYEINSEIIGGLILKIQDKTIDLSINAKIKNLEKQLI